MSASSISDETGVLLNPANAASQMATSYASWLKINVDIGTTPE